MGMEATGPVLLDLKPQYEALKTEIHRRIETVLEHGQFIMGPEVAECERVLAAACGVPHAISCASGTDALVMALMALGVGPGDEVITSAFSFIATAEAILLVGATPVYVDIDSQTYNIDPKAIEKAITSRSRVIMPVSLYGQPADFAEINALASANDLVVIEDGAQSFGSTYEGRPSCGLSTIGCTSFFPAKPLGCYGDGGGVFTADAEICESLVSVRNHGQKERYHHVRIGINGRLDTLQCAVLLEKMKRFPWEIEQRQRIANAYNEAFSELPGVVCPMVRSGRTSVWAQYTLAVRDRDRVQSELRALGIPTSIHYPRTMPDQPAYQGRGVCHDISRARRAADQVISLPLYPDMPESAQDQVISAVRKVLG